MDRATSAPFSLRTRLRLVLGVLATLTVASGLGAACTALVCYRGRVESERYEEAARRASRIGQLAREQYIHEAHTLLVGDRSHVEHHDAWVERLHAEIAEVRSLLSETERSNLDLVEERSRDVAAIFASKIVPAVLRGDLEATRAAHAEADDLVHRMTSTADELAVALSARAHATETDAERTSWAVTILVLMASVFASVYGLFVAQRLWRDVAQPLAQLERVARRVGDGDRSARMGEPALLELAPLATAFDGMLDALATKEDALRAADRLAAIGRVAAGVAHELNNPLGVIRGYVKTLQRCTPDASLAADLRTVDDEAAVCQRIVEDLLAYAKVPALNPVDTDASELAQQAVDRCSPSGGPSVELDVERASIRVDALRMRQVLVNLIRNALQASASEPVQVRGAPAPGGAYVFRILDRGSGVDPAVRDRLFEPFVSTRPDGSGLGLAVSYGLVTAHGGTLRATPRAGGGTEVVIELPGVVGTEEEPG